MKHTISPIYSIFEWITRFAYINILWGVFTLLGAVILGFYPATTAMFAIIRKWLQGESDLPVFKTFWGYFKKEFLKSNLLGIFITLFIVIIGLDINYIRVTMQEELNWFIIPFILTVIVFVLFIFYVFPSFVHYDLKVTKLIKNTFLIMLISPVHNILLVISIGSLYFIFDLIPGLAFFFGASVYGLFTMWLCLDRFNRISSHQNKQA